MELYYRTIDSIRHVIYVGDGIVSPEGPASYEITTLDGVVVAEGTSSSEDGVYTALVGSEVTGDFEPKVITWTYTIDGNEIETAPEIIEIVRPYIMPDTYNRTAPGQELDIRNFRMVESKVRKVIESYCRQSFQIQQHVVKTAVGHTGNALQLPERLIRFKGMSVVDEPIASLVGYPGIMTYPNMQDGTNYELLRGDGIARHSLNEYVSFNPDRPWEIRRRLNAEAGGMNPINRSQFFSSHKQYAILGDWGWEYIPNDIQQAAAILIADYANDDATYREKYIDNVRAADWRMEFAATGNETTGNANADMMLERYRNYRLEVI